MRSIVFAAILFGILFWTLAGCELVKQDDHQNLLVVDSTVEFSVREDHRAYSENGEPVEPVTELKLETTEKYPCVGYEIVANLSAIDDYLQLSINGIKETKNCRPLVRPATGKFPLKLKPGSYTLNLRYNKGHLFQLVVTDSSLHVNGDPTPQFKPAIRTFWRYPEQSFAFRCSAGTENRNKCTEFEELLNQFHSLTPLTFPENGEIPYRPPSSSRHIVSYYLYPDEQAYADMGTMLHSYAERELTGTGVFIQLRNWKNKLFYTDSN